MPDMSREEQRKYGVEYGQLLAEAKKAKDWDRYWALRDEVDERNRIALEKRDKERLQTPFGQRTLRDKIISIYSTKYLKVMDEDDLISVKDGLDAFNKRADEIIQEELDKDMYGKIVRQKLCDTINNNSDMQFDRPLREQDIKWIKDDENKGHLFVDVRSFDYIKDNFVFSISVDGNSVKYGLSELEKGKENKKRDDLIASLESDKELGNVISKVSNKMVDASEIKRRVANRINNSVSNVQFDTSNMGPVNLSWNGIYFEIKPLDPEIRDCVKELNYDSYKELKEYSKMSISTLTEIYNKMGNVENTLNEGRAR